MVNNIDRNEKPLGMIINAKFVPLDDSDTELAMRLNPKKSSKGMVWGGSGRVVEWKLM